MNYIGKFLTNFREFYNEINSATLTGAIDVVVVRQPDGTYLSSPFHVRFGKIGVLRSREKIVDIEVNNEPIDIHMKLGESGEAFFVEETEEEEVPLHLATSPIPPSPNLEEELRKLKESAKIENGLNGEIVTNDEQYNSTKFPFHTNIDSIGANDLQNSVLNHVNTEERVKAETLVSDSKLHNGVTDNSVGESDKVLNSVVNNSTSVGESDKLLNSVVNNSTVTLNGPRIPSDVPNFMPILEETSIGIQTGVSANEKAEEISAIEHTVRGVITEECEDGKSRRKRKKRIRTKVRSSFRDIKVPIPIKEGIDIPVKHNSPYVTVDQRVPDGPEDIFQMDEDLDEGFSAASMIRSMSLPLNSSEYRRQLHEQWPTRRLSATYTGELHPFSDGDVTPMCSPPGSRPPSPKSDTEFETQKHDATSQTDCSEVSWDWGELPNLPKKGTDGKGKKVLEEKVELASSDDEDIAKRSQKTEEEKRSMLGGMWNFMRSTKKLRHMPESEGIYLDDFNFNDLDPEVAALYFPKFKSEYPVDGVKEQICDEDAESGNGPSLPQSPHSVEGAIGGPQCLDSDSDDRHSFYDYCSKHYNDLAMSLCGGLQDTEGEVPAQCFLQSIITYDDFSENPSIIQNPNLVIRMNGKYYNWQTAAPMILSMVMFQRSLPEKTFMQLIDAHMPKKKKQKGFSGWWYWRRTNPTSETDSKKDQPALPETNVVDQVEKPEPEKVSELVEKQVPTSQELPIETKSTSSEVPTTTIETASRPVYVHISSESSSVTSSPSKGHLDLVKSQEDFYASTSSETEAELAGGVGEDKKVIRTKRSHHHEKYKKSLRLTSEGIANLNLKEGENEVVFSVTTAYQGTTRCKCNIYLWNYDDKIIISDIDGTITKSDVLGHLLPIIGKDWAQLGVAKLFSKAQDNGYQFLYLSARAIGQARITRDYLRSVRQGDITLPDGPLLLSPTSLINAFHREVIEKRPEDFKISCLKDIKALFPPTSNPFYAGFGNKINDTWAYRAVDIPMGRIFTINHRGELKLELIQTFQSSYTRLSDVVDHIFPPLQRRRAGNLAPNFPASDEYSYFTYWRYPLPKLDENDELIACKEK